MNIMLALVALVLTVLLYMGFDRLRRHFHNNLINPVVLSVVSLVLIMLLFNWHYESYQQGAQFISLWLEPSVVALGLPLYQQLEELRQDLVPVLLCCLVGTLVAIISMVLMAGLIGLTLPTVVSLAPKAVTTAIALVLAKDGGGIPALTTVTVIYVGMLGAMVGLPFMRLIGLRSPKALGLAMGSGSHALGTARMAEEGHPMGAYSAVALVLCGLFTAILMPLLVPLLVTLLNLS